MKQPENALIVKEGEGQQDAVALGDGIFMSRGISNSYLVTTSDGDVQINTGMHFEAADRCYWPSTRRDSCRIARVLMP